MALVPQYVYSASTPGPPIVSALSIRHIPAQNPDKGLRLSIGNVAALQAPPLPWPVAPTGQMVASGPNDLGLYTLGQFQCICIAVAIYPTPATPNWTQAWLAHASHPNHTVIQNIINTLTAANHDQAYVVIASKQGGAWLNQISAQFAAAVDANGASIAPAQVWLYSTTDPATFSFGIQRDGVFGQLI